MKPFVARPILSLKAEVSVLGDKSIAHRALILSALSSGKTTIKNFPRNNDCLYTLNALKELGIKIKERQSKKPLGSSVVTVFGRGLHGLGQPKSPIFVGDSGTTMRLLLGVLAGQGFSAELAAGKSLSRRPMKRVTEPLRLMGAQINSRQLLGEEYAPIRIKGGRLKSITYKMPVASAQVKSAIILAGLYAAGKTCVIEPALSRDHTERMLRLFKANLQTKQNIITINTGRELISPREIYIPGDISSAAFFMVLAAIIKNSRLIIRNVSLNPSRSGIIRVLRRMGANIRVKRYRVQGTGLEPIGDIVVKGSSLRGITVRRKEIPSLIDELPILMVAASYARGKTVLEGAGELRVKETDRIRSMSGNLKKMGADIVVAKAAGGLENIVIRGVKELKGARVMAFADHRTAMSMVIAGLKASGKTRIDDVSCIDKSFPHFLNLLRSVIE